MMWWIFVVLLCALFLFSFVLPKRIDKATSAFGSAEFGKPNYHKRNHGVCINGKERLSTQDSFRHICLIAGSGGSGGAKGGKSTTYVIPSILRLAREKRKKHQASIVILDIKGSLHTLLSGYLEEQGYSVVSIDFTNPPKSDTYNPLSRIRSEQESKEFAFELFDLSNQYKSTEGIWRVGASMILFWLIELLRQIGEPYCTIANLTRLLYQVDNGTPVIEQLIQTHLPNTSIQLQYKAFMQSDGKLRSSQLATAISTLIEYDTQDIKSLTSDDTLYFNLIRKRKTAIFIKTPVASGNHSHLITIFFRQLLQYFLETPVRKDDLPVYCLLDEFGNLGKIGSNNTFVQALTLLRSQKISLSLILQDISQLQSVYGNDQAKGILSGCGHILAYPGIRGDSISYLSKQLGTSTFEFLEEEKQKRVARPLHTFTEIREMLYGICLPSSAQASKFDLYPIFSQKRLMRKCGIVSQDGSLRSSFPPSSPKYPRTPMKILEFAVQETTQDPGLSFDERLKQLLKKKTNG